MFKKRVILILIILSSVAANAGNKIKFYFNHPVDNSVSTMEKAVYLNSCTADTMIAYINRAHYTIDVAVYDFSYGSYANIAGAINSAYGRGVKVRWIYDGSSTNSGLSGLNSAINKLASPTGSSYSIMHNKFMIIDAHSPVPADAVVWTGSTNWSYSQMNTDYNNVVIIQDSALAHAYTDEFNMMWGSTGLIPNSAVSKFGPDKTDLGRHIFNVDGYKIELYFSPSDGTNTQIQNSISSASTDLYFGVYTFTDNSDASAIMSKYSSGVYVSGIIDNFSNSYTPYSTFTSGLGSHFISYSGTGIYHNKYLIVDPSNRCSDPLVLTGSHNWSLTANSKNDENTLIIHSDIAANVYYQSFKADFTGMGGSLSPFTVCPLEVYSTDKAKENLLIYPNPANGKVNFKYELSTPQNVCIDIYNTVGQKITSLINNEFQQAGNHLLDYTFNNNGIYFVNLTTGNAHYTKKVVIQN